LQFRSWSKVLVCYSEAVLPAVIISLVIIYFSNDSMASIKVSGTSQLSM